MESKNLKLPKSITKPFKVLYYMSCSDVRVYKFFPSGRVHVLELEPPFEISDKMIDSKGRFWISDANSRRSYDQSRTDFIQNHEDRVKRKKETYKDYMFAADLPYIMKIKKIKVKNGKNL